MAEDDRLHIGVGFDFDQNELQQQILDKLDEIEEAGVKAARGMASMEEMLGEISQYDLKEARAGLKQVKKDIEEANQRLANSQNFIKAQEQLFIRAANKKAQAEKKLKEIQESGNADDYAVQRAQADVEKYSQELDKCAEALKNTNQAQAETAQELDFLSGVYDGLNQRVDDLSQKEISLATQLKAIREEMTKLKLAGQDQTEEYRKLAEQAANLQDRISDTRAEIRNSADDVGKLRGATQLVSTMASTYTTAIGIMSLFSDEIKNNENAQKVMQATMSVGMGLMQVTNALQKESAIMVLFKGIQDKAAAKAQAMKTAAEASGIPVTKTATLAQKAFNAVAKANPYVLLAMAIVAVVTAIWGLTKAMSKNKKEQDENTKSAKEFFDTIKNGGKNGNVIDMIQSYKELSKILPELTKKYSAYQIALGEVSDTELRNLELQKEYTDSYNKEKQAIEKNLQAHIENEGLASDDTTKVYYQKKIDEDKKKLEELEKQYQKNIEKLNKYTSIEDYEIDRLENKINLLKNMQLQAKGTAEELEILYQIEKETAKLQDAKDNTTTGKTATQLAERLASLPNEIEGVRNKLIKNPLDKTLQKKLDLLLAVQNNFNSAYSRLTGKNYSDIQQDAENKKKAYKDALKAQKQYNAEQIKNEIDRETKLHELRIKALKEEISTKGKLAVDIEIDIENSRFDAKIKEIKEKITDRLYQLQEEIDKLNINLMPDSEKSYANLQYDYEEYLTNLQKQEDEELATIANTEQEKQALREKYAQLRELKEKEYLKAVEDLDKENADKQKENIKELTEAAAAYEKKIQQIKESFEKGDISAAEAQAQNFVAGEEYKTAKQKASENGVSETQIGDIEYFTSTIEQTVTALEDEAVSWLLDFIAQIDEQLANLIEGSEEYNDLMAQRMVLEESIANLQSKEKDDNKEKKQQDALFASINKNMSQLKNVNGQIKNFVNMFGGYMTKNEKLAAETTTDIIDMATSVLPSLLNAISSLDAFASSSTASIVAVTVGAETAVVSTSTAASTAIQTMEKASVILAIIGAALQIAQTIANAIMSATASNKIKKDIEESNQQLERLEHKQKSINQQNQLNNVGAAYWKEYAKNIGIAREKQEEYNHQMEDYNKLMDKSKEGSKKHQEAEEGWWEAQEKYNEQLLKEKEILEEMQSHFVGTTLEDFANSLADNILEGFENGLTDGKEAFQKSLNDIKKSMIKTMLADQAMVYYKEAFAKLGDNLSDGVFSAEERDEFIASMTEADENMENYIEAIREVYDSLNLDGSFSAESSGFQAMNQDTAEELNGRFATLQANGISIDNKMSEQLSYSKQMAEDIMLARTIAQDQLNELAQINHNTAIVADYMPEATQYLKQIKNSLQ